MKTGIRNLALLPLALVFAATVGAASPPTSHSASKKATVSPSSSMLVSTLVAPNLGAAGSFAVLAAATVTNTGPSAINGDLGLSPGTAVTGFAPGMLSGTQHIADPASAQAQLDLTAAYNDAAGRTLGAITLAGNLGGMTLAPGLYKSTSSLEISSGDLTLDAKGDASAVYIFQMGSTLVTTVGRKVILAGGAQAANIYWQVGSSATLGVSSVFKGTIMAMASITATTGASVEGRLLARTAAVTLDNNVVNVTAASVSPVAVGGAAGVCQDVTTLVAGGSSGGICSSAAFTSGANSTVNGSVTAKAAITLGATSRVHGDVTAGAAYTSGDGSVVDGNVSASGAVTLGANSRILGTVHSGTGVITYGAGATVGGVSRAFSAATTVGGASSAFSAATTCLDVTTLVAGGSSGGICSSAAFTSGANSTVNGSVTAKAAITLGATSRVHGDVTAGAAYTSGDGSVVDGNVSASGAVTLGANSRILGTVHSGTGVITYGAGATVGGVSRAISAATTCLDVTTLVAGGSSGGICSSAAFTSGANSTVNGWVTAKAATTLGATSRVHGDVTAGAAYTSGDGSVVDGNVSASGDITLGANSRILGTVHSGTGVITYGAGATVGRVI